MNKRAIATLAVAGGVSLAVLTIAQGDNSPFFNSGSGDLETGRWSDFVLYWEEAKDLTLEEIVEGEHIAAYFLEEVPGKIEAQAEERNEIFRQENDGDSEVTMSFWNQEVADFYTGNHALFNISYGGIPLLAYFWGVPQGDGDDFAVINISSYAQESVDSGYRSYEEGHEEAPFGMIRYWNEESWDLIEEKEIQIAGNESTYEYWQGAEDFFVHFIRLNAGDTVVEIMAHGLSEEEVLESAQSIKLITAETPNLSLWSQQVDEFREQMNEEETHEDLGLDEKPEESETEKELLQEEVQEPTSEEASGAVSQTSPTPPVNSAPVEQTPIMETSGVSPAPDFVLEEGTINEAPHVQDRSFYEEIMVWDWDADKQVGNGIFLRMAESIALDWYLNAGEFYNIFTPSDDAMLEFVGQERIDWLMRKENYEARQQFVMQHVFLTNEQSMPYVTSGEPSGQLMMTLSGGMYWVEDGYLIFDDEGYFVDGIGIEIIDDHYGSSFEVVMQVTRAPLPLPEWENELIWDTPRGMG